MDTSLDDKELSLEATFFLGKINPDKGRLFRGNLHSKRTEKDEDITVI